jgi:hypothetical protein
LPFLPFWHATSYLLTLQYFQVVSQPLSYFHQRITLSLLRPISSTNYGMPSGRKWVSPFPLCLCMSLPASIMQNVCNFSILYTSLTALLLFPGIGQQVSDWMVYIVFFFKLIILPACMYCNPFSPCQISFVLASV